jgi:hypothetical protein
MEYRQLEDVLRVLVVAVLAIWAGWGFMVGLRAKEGRVAEVTDHAPETSYGASVDDGEITSTPRVSGRPKPL